MSVCWERRERCVWLSDDGVSGCMCDGVIMCMYLRVGCDVHLMIRACIFGHVSLCVRSCCVCVNTRGAAAGRVSVWS